MDARVSWPTDITYGTSAVSVSSGSATPPPHRKSLRFTGPPRRRRNGTSISPTTSSVTSTAPAYIQVPRRSIDAAEGPAGSSADWAPAQPATSAAGHSTRPFASRLTRRLQGVEVGRDVARLLEAEPDVWH